MTIIVNHNSSSIYENLKGGERERERERERFQSCMITFGRRAANG